MVCMRDKAKVGWSRVGRFWGTSRVRGDALMTPDHTAIAYLWVGSNRNWPGRHVKATVRCPCSRLTALHHITGTAPTLLHVLRSTAIGSVPRIYNCHSAAIITNRLLCVDFSLLQHLDSFRVAC